MHLEDPETVTGAVASLVSDSIIPRNREGSTTSLPANPTRKLRYCIIIQITFIIVALD